MVSFQVSIGGQPALRFKVAARAVLFAGSRRGQVEQPVCRALVERFRRHGFGFFVGCATGVDAAFRAALAHSACGPDEVFVGCAFGQRARRCRAEGLFASAVVPEGIPPQRGAGAAHPVAGQAQLAGGAVSRTARRPAVGVRARGLPIARRSTTSSRPSWWPHGRLSLRRSVGWRPPTCSPRSTATGWCRTPSATASATTSTEGPDRSIGLPADRQGHAHAQPGARRPARSPSGPPSGPAKQPTAPDLVSWSVGRMPAVDPWRPGRAPRVQRHRLRTLSRPMKRRHHRDPTPAPPANCH